MSLIWTEINGQLVAYPTETRYKITKVDELFHLVDECGERLGEYETIDLAKLMAESEEAATQFAGMARLGDH